MGGLLLGFILGFSCLSHCLKYLFIGKVQFSKVSCQDLNQSYYSAFLWVWDLNTERLKLLGKLAAEKQGIFVP